MANLKAARNEFESFQVLVQADGTGIANLRVDPGKPLGQIDPATGQPIDGGATIPAANLTFYREHFLDITKTSDSEGAVGPWPDALIPEKDYIYGEDRNAFPYSLGPNEKAVAWIDVLVPEDQPAGTYKGSVLVKNDASPVPSGGGQVLKEIPVTVEVKGFKIEPETTLDSAFMMGQNRSPEWKDDPCTGHPAAACDTEEERWKLYAQYARVALENRVTIPNPFAVGDPGNAPSAAQQPMFEKYGLPLINGLSSAKPLGNPEQSRLNGVKLTSVGAWEWCVYDGANYVAGCLDRWEQLANNHGFADRFFLYTDDEMNITAEWGEFKRRADYARQVWPGVRTLITGPINSSTSPIDGSTVVGAEPSGAVPLIDTIVTLVNYMDGKDGCNPHKVFTGNQRDRYNNFLDPAQDTPNTPANRLWLYTSNMSFSSDTSEHCLYDGWPGYAIDQPDTQSRAMGWMSYYYGASGELYWMTTQNLDRAWTDQYEQGGNGDGNLFYPGTTTRIGGTTDIPVESMRLKRIRDGREDYEYMKKLEQQGKKQEALNIVQSIYGDKDYLTTCPAGSPRPTSPDGGCGDSAMYMTPSAAKLDQARLQLWNSVTPDTPQADCLSAAGSSAGVTGAGTWADPLKGTTGDDVILGTGGDDLIVGLDGNDVLCGRGGYDSFRGGPGDDTIDGEDASNAVYYEGGDAPAGAGVKVDLATGTATGHGTDKLHNINEVYGTPNQDAMVGDAEQNYLEGRDGDDSLNGAGGSDGLEGGPGSDRLNSRDGVADGAWRGVVCGDGADYVIADAKGVDTIAADCEPTNIDYPDTTAPSGRVTVNGGAAYTKSAAVSLALSASDAGGVSSMRFSNDGANWSAWGAYATTKAWTLVGANGTKTVHAQYRDGAGNVSATVRDTIVLDNTPPTVSGMSPKNASATTDVTPTVRAIVRDNLTNLQKANVKLYVNGVLISPTKYSYNASTDALVYNSPKVAKGKKKVKIVATDAAKNVRTTSWYFTIK